MQNEMLELPLDFTLLQVRPRAASLEAELAAFCEFGKPTEQTLTEVTTRDGVCLRVPTFINEFWTSRQRAAHSLHEISYRACFKPQLPRFFIERLTAPGDLVYDPFMGRGTTLLEAALLGRQPAGCDINPLSPMLIEPRLDPPDQEAVVGRIEAIDFDRPDEWPEELLVFYHPETLREIVSLKRYLLERQAAGTLDKVDAWIRLVALNRLTGHSAGFFSVYTLPPNQAVSVKSQQRINERRKQTPPRRHVPELILKKSRKLLSACDRATRQRLASAGEALVRVGDAASSPWLPDESVRLVVTSPPFLDVVDYATDNWLRCWFVGLDAQKVELTITHGVRSWAKRMTAVFRELHRVLRPDGHVAFEVGEVEKGTIKLEETVIACGHAAGLHPRLVLINSQVFTKTANCWGVKNNSKGTNTNRVVLFSKFPLD